MNTSMIQIIKKKDLSYLEYCACN